MGSPTELILELPMPKSGPSNERLFTSSDISRVPRNGRIMVATIHISPFTCCFCFCKFFRRPFTGLFRNEKVFNENSHNHSYVRYSLFRFTGEWFTNHSNHIHRFTPITRITPITGIVATKGRIVLAFPQSLESLQFLAKGLSC